MKFARVANLAFALTALATPLAHVLELPNKLSLSGPLWLGIQQHLYHGWGPFLGGPAEIGALLTSLALLVLDSPSKLRRMSGLFSVAYASMIAAFLTLNRPVNNATRHWTAVNLPADWTTYRLRWEIGHAVAFALALVGLCSILVARDWIRIRNDQVAA